MLSVFHELDTVSLRLHIGYLVEQFLVIRVQGVHLTEITFSYPNNDDTHRYPTRLDHLVDRMGHIMDDSISQYEKHSVV